MHPKIHSRYTDISGPSTVNNNFEANILKQDEENINKMNKTENIPMSTTAALITTKIQFCFATKKNKTITTVNQSQKSFTAEDSHDKSVIPIMI